MWSYISENGRCKWYWKTPLSSEVKCTVENLQKLASLEARKKREMLQQGMKFMENPGRGNKIKDGHYQIPLPFKHCHCNKYQAAQRLSYFNKNEKFKADYIRFMEEIISKGYARMSTITKHQGR